MRETGVQVEGGGGWEGAIGLPGFTVRIRHGIVEKLDGNAELGYQRIRVGSDDLRLQTTRNIFTGRIGAKYALVDHVALTAGVAFGGWAGGAFVSPDLSLILAWENPYCVPFIDGGGYTSHPIRPRNVVITDLDPTDFFGDEGLVAAPVLTYGWTAGFGLRIPLLHRGYDRKTPPAMVLGARVRGAYYDPIYNDFGRDIRIYWYGSIGFEYVFGGRTRPTWRLARSRVRQPLDVSVNEAQPSWPHREEVSHD